MFKFLSFTSFILSTSSSSSYYYYYYYYYFALLCAKRRKFYLEEGIGAMGSSVLGNGLQETKFILRIFKHNHRLF